MRESATGSLLAFAVLLSGCWATTRSVDPPELREVHDVEVVAMQPPPLALALQPGGSSLTVAGVATSFPALVVIGGLWVLLDLPASAHRARSAGEHGTPTRRGCVLNPDGGVRSARGEPAARGTRRGGSTS